MSDGVFWLRLYHSILDNPKTASLHPATFGNWIKLLILASRNTPRGQLPAISVIAKHLGRSYSAHPSRINPMLAYLFKLGLLDKDSSDNYLIHNFYSRQWIAPTKGSTICRYNLVRPSTTNNRLTDFELTKNPGTESEYSTYTTNIYIIIKALNTKISNNVSLIIKRINDFNRKIDSSSPVSSKRLYGRSSASSPRTSRPMRENEGYGGDQSPTKTQQTKRLFADYPASRIRIKHNQVITRLFDYWQTLPGLVKHKQCTDTDRDGIRRTLAVYDEQSIKLAMDRYSQFVMGSKAGKYRQAYRWSLYEFVTRKRHNLIARFSSDSWEDTCVKFDSNRSHSDRDNNRSVKSLLDKVEKLKREKSAAKT